MSPLRDVFTVDEIARAAGVPIAAVEAIVTSGRVRSIGTSRFFHPVEAVRAGRLARLEVRSSFCSTLRPAIFTLPTVSRAQDRRIPALGSSLVHIAALTILVLSTSGAARTAPPVAPVSTRLVFWAGPGPGGGGGGMGRAPKVETRRIAAPRPTPSPTATRQPEPIPSRMLVAPVAASAGDARLESLEENGQGSGVGSGLDEGSGGGVGGGPFRPGSGIEPPQLLREVKAQYSEAARSRGVTGSVVLEIVVRRDGSVGDVTVVRGLGHGLDEQATTAVRSWRFAPATRQGQPVDVIVEVEVDFSLR